jgi:hypothetical protein
VKSTVEVRVRRRSMMMARFVSCAIKAIVIILVCAVVMVFTPRSAEARMAFCPTDAAQSGTDDCGARLPFGISANYMYIDERLKIVDFSAVVNGVPIPSGLVQFESLVHRTQTQNAKIDYQPFPFLDLYVIGGHVSGRAKNLDLTLSPMLPMQGLFTPGMHVDYRGGVYGGGGTLTGGVGSVFLSYDVNYTWTDIDALDNNARTLVQSGRLHWCFNPAEDIRASLYGGTMYARIKASQRGSIHVDGNVIDFTLKARQAYPWNALAGMQLEFLPHWDLTLEGGFMGRRQALASLAYRF